jgi:hypothetical protein
MATNREAQKRNQADARARANAEVAAAQVAYLRAKKDLKYHLHKTNVTRHTKRREMAAELHIIRRRMRQAPRELYQAVVERRAAYRAWWREVLLERQMRRDELARLADELRGLRKALPATLKQRLAEYRRDGAEELASDAAKADLVAAKLGAAVREAGRRVKSVRAGARLGALRKAAKVPGGKRGAARRKTDAADEWFDEVGRNLEPDVAAYFGAHRKHYDAMRRGDVTPHQAATRIAEEFESEPNRVLEWQMTNADARVAELLGLGAM